MAKKRVAWTPAERWFQRGVVGLVVALALAAGWFALREEMERAVIPVGSDIRLPLGVLKPGKLRLLRYATENATSVPVAIERGEDKIIRVALGSCRNCWASAPYISSGKLVCGRCRKVMQLPDPETANGEKRGCALAAVPYSIADEHLVVSGESVVAEVARQFTSQTSGEKR